MGGGRLCKFCLNRIATHARSPREARPITGGPPTACASSARTKFEGNCVSMNRKIMVVVDGSPEAKRALLWTLSHTVQDNDTIILLHLVRLSTPSKPGSNGSDGKEWEESKEQIDRRSYEVPNSLKTLSKSRRPEVEVEVEVVVAEGKEKGPTVVSQAKKHSVSLLILGQRKPSLLWRLLMTWAGGKSGDGGVVEYCIQNADCMTVAVRRKSRRTGGYLITTKRQKNFWLLA